MIKFTSFESIAAFRNPLNSLKSLSNFILHYVKSVRICTCPINNFYIRQCCLVIIRVCIEVFYRDRYDTRACE